MVRVSGALLCVALAMALADVAHVEADQHHHRHHSVAKDEQSHAYDHGSVRISTAGKKGLPVYEDQGASVKSTSHHHKGQETVKDNGDVERAYDHGKVQIHKKKKSAPSSSEHRSHHQHHHMKVPLRVKTYEDDADSDGVSVVASIENGQVAVEVDEDTDKDWEAIGMVENLPVFVTSRKGHLDIQIKSHPEQAVKSAAAASADDASAKSFTTPTPYVPPQDVNAVSSDLEKSTERVSELATKLSAGERTFSQQTYAAIFICGVVGALVAAVAVLAIVVDRQRSTQPEESELGTPEGSPTESDMDVEAGIVPKSEAAAKDAAADQRDSLSDSESDENSATEGQFVNPNHVFF